jgi:hypothetical protein
VEIGKLNTTLKARNCNLSFIQGAAAHALIKKIKRKQNYPHI